LAVPSVPDPAASGSKVPESAVPVVPGLDQAAALSTRVLRRRLIALARPFATPLIGSLACRVGQLAAGIALLALSGWAVGRMARPGAELPVTPLVWGLAGLSLAKGVLRYGEQFAGHLVAFKTLARLRVYFYDRLEPQAPAAVEGRATGDLLSRVTKDVDRVEVFFAHTLVPAAAAVIVPLATVVAAGVLVSPVAAAVLALALLGVGLVVPLVGSRSSARAAARLRAGRGAMAQHLTDSVQGTPEILAFGHQPDRLARQAELEQPISRALTGLSRWIALRRGANSLLIAATLIVQLAWAAQAGLPLERLTLLLALSLAAFAPALAVEDFAADLQQAYASARRLFEITDAAPLVPNRAAEGVPPDGAEGWTAAGVITLAADRVAGNLSLDEPVADGAGERFPADGAGRRSAPASQSDGAAGAREAGSAGGVRGQEIRAHGVGERFVSERIGERSSSADQSDGATAAKAVESGKDDDRGQDRRAQDGGARGSGARDDGARGPCVRGDGANGSRDQDRRVQTSLSRRPPHPGGGTAVGRGRGDHSLPLPLPDRSEGWRARAALVAPEVVFDHVSFSYPALGGGSSRRRPAVADVSLTAQGGRVTALVGASGSGKSTLAALLVRAWDPDSGAIRLAGRDLRDFPLDQLRAEVGLTPQRPYLFNDTIEGNLRLSRPEADAAEIAAVARLSRLDAVLAELPDGLASPIGDLGERLSGGQRQRLALARSLLARPAVLVLDEATSQVDLATEELILRRVRRAARGQTLILVAHRLSLVAEVDQVVVLDEGRVVESGRPDDLARAGGPFARLLARETA
jgi:ABC-type multidrug transport system fused ATPase/permease subunit